MRRHILEVTTVVRIRDNDRNVVKEGSTNKEVAVDISGRGLHDIIDQSVAEVNEASAGQAKLMFADRATDLRGR